ncbi:hypothetical protein [Paraburkholderia hospita]|uniref:hypothetical protein n=1 Tax=Paraburkholderia hospita TaxID=169430 RepID=UPI000684341F|nr:hypothetical protein [Paraburkholderia hospita]
MTVGGHQRNREEHQSKLVHAHQIHADEQNQAGCGNADQRITVSVFEHQKQAADVEHGRDDEYDGNDPGKKRVLLYAVEQHDQGHRDHRHA